MITAGLLTLLFGGPKGRLGADARHKLGPRTDALGLGPDLRHSGGTVVLQKWGILWQSMVILDSRKQTNTHKTSEAVLDK